MRHIEYQSPIGIPAALCVNFNLLTKGRAIVGAIHGTIVADAGSVGTSELANSAVTSAKIASLAVGTTDIANSAVTAAKIGSSAVTVSKIGNGAVTDVKRVMTWSTLGNTTKSVVSVTVSAIGGFLVTNTGTSKGVVITGSTAGDEISIPAVGDHFRFVVDATPGTTRQIEIKSTAATFNAAGAKVIGLSEVAQHVAFQAISATRWVVTEFSTGVTFAATT